MVQNHEHPGQRDHGITSNLNVLASLAQSSPHHNANSQSQNIQFSGANNSEQIQRGYNPVVSEKAIAIAAAIAAVGNYPNHSPPPYQNQGQGGENHNGSSNGNHGSANSNYNNQSPPLMRYYTSGRHQHQQVKCRLIYNEMNVNDFWYAFCFSETLQVYSNYINHGITCSLS